MAPSAPKVAHANATKGDEGRRRDPGPGSSSSGAPLQAAPPSASPAEPSPGHGSAERRHGRVDGEDAGRASSRTNTSYMPAKSNIFLMIGF